MAFSRGAQSQITLPARRESGDSSGNPEIPMLCETCRFTERPGFVRKPAGPERDGSGEYIPCPDCGGQGIAHCCDGICAQAADTPGAVSD
jgi:hypothetical protein